ncbi:MAG TPA: MFS transporter [Polyangiales bacterium]|nr:MFS transporter [Polyangiales bacterium]
MSSPAKLLALLALYFAQGLPFGFQAGALPLLLRERGASLQAIGFAAWMSAPWLLKALWAPLVDRYGSARFGRRKSWIVPMQAAMAVCALAAARADQLQILYGLIFLMNSFAATQDAAVDGLAVSWLEPRELGLGNAVQVVGYKLGMLTSGGLLIYAREGLAGVLGGDMGYRGVFLAMAMLLSGVMLVSLWLPEPQSEEHGALPVDFSALFARLWDALRQPAAAGLIAVVVTYKLGETLADTMWKPMLFDRGFSAAKIGLWSGTFGMVCSLLGSAAAGWLARALPLVAALLWVSALRAVGVGGEYWLSVLSAPSATAVIVVTCLEHFFGGALTTVLFAMMMRHTDRAIGATHYTLLASLEVWGKLPLAGLSGVLAVSLGYPGLFALSTALCVAFALLAWSLRSRLAA